MPEDGETFEEIVNAEHEMVRTASDKYGVYFTHAVNTVTLLNNILTAPLLSPARFLFITFHSQVKKHITLALLSAVRQHHVQCGMNTRQVLEAGAWAAYALAHDDPNLFRTQTPQGAEVPRSLSRACNRWISGNYEEHSNTISRLKNQINESVAHANIVYAFETFNIVTEGRTGFSTPFFDIEDEFQIKTDLLMVSNIAMGMIRLFLDVNRSERVFQPPDGFEQDFDAVMREHDRLRAEIKGHERFRRFTNPA